MEGVQKTFEDLLQKFSSLTTEVQQQGTQVADFGEGLDTVKRKQAQQDVAARAAPSSSTAPTATLLINNGPPLLHQPPQPPPLHTRLAQDCHDDHRERWPSPPPSSHDAYRHKPPKHDFSRFGGEAPFLWFDLCHTYFDLYQTPPEQWVTMAVLYKEGHAALWCQAFKRVHGLGDWATFTAAVQAEFGQDEFDALLHRLHHLKQRGSVSDYRLAFESIMYHLIALDPSLNNKFFVSQFIIGLRDEVCTGVHQHAPTSMSRAAAPARIQEEETEHTRSRGRPVIYARALLPPPVATVAAGPIPPRNDGAKRGPDDFSRENQLREFRRAKGLCFNCRDKYNREQKCNKIGQLLTIEVGDHGELMSDDAIRALELLDENPEDAAACYHILAHAVAGTKETGTMRLRALVGNQVMLLLVDSDSTHTFVNAALAARAGCVMQAAEPVTVHVANGDTLQSTQQVSKLNWWCQGHTFSTDMRLLELGAYDAVLGVDWLAQFSPMNCHWDSRPWNSVMTVLTSSCKVFALPPSLH